MQTHWILLYYCGALQNKIMESAALHWLTKEIKEFNVQIKRIGVNMQYHRYTLHSMVKQTWIYYYSYYLQIAQDHQFAF